MENNSLQFEFEGKTYTVSKPSNKVRKESNAIYNKAFRDALDADYLLEMEITELMKKRGFVEKDYNKQRSEIMKNIRKHEAKLINEEYSSLDEGRTIAFKTQDLRDELDAFETPFNEMKSQSASSYGEGKRFAYNVYRCTVDSEGQKVWDSFDEFEDDESQLAILASSKMLSLLCQSNQDSANKVAQERTENVWLKQHGFMNSDLQLINKAGQTVDRDGKLIDKDGNYVDESGNRVDIFGNPLDKDGKLISKKAAKEATANTPKEVINTATDSTVNNVETVEVGP